MKRIYTLLCCAFFSISLMAQAPQKISYQSVIRSSNNTLLANTAVGMKISILQGSANGTIVYEETHQPTTNTNGLVSIGIGGGTAITGTFSTIDWSLGSYFVKTETDPAGGANYTLTGTSELLSVPFALYAKTAGSGGGMAPGTVTGQMNYWNGTAWVSIPHGVRGQSLNLCDGGIPTWGPCPTTLPVVQTLTASASNGIMTANANVVSDGGTDITHRGVLFGGIPNLTIYSLTVNYLAVNHSGDVVSGNGIGTYTKSGVIFNDSSIPASGTVYYARAFAINSVGVSYGETVTYTVPNHLNKGDFYQGGIVSYIDTSLEHGLIVAPSDQSTGTYWSVGPNNLNGATGTEIGTGENNTTFIMFNQGNNALAAKLCYDLELGGYSDWFLPSEEELFTAINYLVPAQYVGNATGCSDTTSYWTSSESNANEVSILANNVVSNYDYYDNFICSKNQVRRVRAVRKF